MDFGAAISEPLVRLISFHNAFNRSMKITFGALAMAEIQAASKGGAIALPTGTEPWGRETRWRNLSQPSKDASVFLAEMGIARATSALEDYLMGAKGEFDRAGLATQASKGNGTPCLAKFDAVVGLDLGPLSVLADFFNVARNCVVHRSNRASAKLEELRGDEALAAAVAGLPRRKGKWAVSLPPIRAGHIVEWQPRHAIMASDVYYRCAVALDQALVLLLGPKAFARMAAHWCFFADPAAPCPAKVNPETMMRSQLTDRYKVSGATLSNTVALLRDAERWEDVRKAWDVRYPDGPETSLPRRRRARRNNPHGHPYRKQDQRA